MNNAQPYTIRQIDESWNEEMLSIIDRSPIEAGGLKLVLDRRPDVFFLPKHVSRKISSAGIFQGEELIGFGMMLHKELYVSGKIRSVLYFGNLVVDPKARGKGFLFRLTDFFLPDMLENKEIGYMIIMKGNSAALKLIGRYHEKFPNIPYTKIIGEYHVQNILLTLPLRTRSSYKIRTASMDDLEAIAGLLKNEYSTRLFGPVISEEKIISAIENLPDFGIENYFLAERNGNIVGVCCAWDMGAVKRNKILEYGPRFKKVSLIINLLSPLFAFSKAPKEGNSFKSVSITDYAVTDRDPEILNAILRNIYAVYRKRRYHTMLFGHPADDPISSSTRPFIKQTVKSDILIFNHRKSKVEEFADPALPFIDMHLL